MKTTTEIKINVSGAKVTNAIVMPDGTCKLTVEMVNVVSNINDKIKVTKKGKIKITKIGYFFDVK